MTDYEALLADRDHPLWHVLMKRYRELELIADHWEPTRDVNAADDLVRQFITDSTNVE